MILDDAGLMFPDDNHPGVDLILPDYTYVLENADKLRGIVITHGHEDHTGTLPYLMKDLDRNVPIYGTKMTLGLIEGKFAEHKIRTPSSSDPTGRPDQAGLLHSRVLRREPLHRAPWACSSRARPETCCTRATSSSIRPPSTA